MQRETKVGLLVGMGVILLIGIIVSDHLSVVRQQESADLTPYGDTIQDGMTPPGDMGVEMAMNRGGGLPPAAQRHEVIPLEGEVVRLPPPQAGGQGQQVQPAPGTPVNPQFVNGQGGTPTLANGGYGVAPLPPQPAPQAPQAPQVVHFVEPRDTLYNIAKKYYGNGEEWRRIAEANPGIVGRKGEVRPGVRLVIPNKVQPATLANNPSFAPVTPQQGNALQPGVPVAVEGRTVTVGPGDTLTKIAGKYLGDKNRWEEIQEANPGVDPRNLKVGTQIKLPAPGNSSHGTMIAPVPAPSDVSSASAFVPAPQPRPVAAAPADKTYVVRDGDTLSSIALKTLGDKRQWQRLYEANRGVLAKPGDLAVGQQLVVPTL